METLNRWREVECALAVLLVACGGGNDTTEPPPPVQVPPTEVQRPADPLRPEESRVVDLAMSFQTTCALTADGRLHCWGENRFGEFGNGTITASAQPVPAGGGLTFDVIDGSMGTPQMCGVARDGTAYCWGYNLNGELGDGTTTHRYWPTRVDANISFRAFASSYHTCGLDTTGAAYCWGSGMGGQLGTGDGLSHLRPTPVMTESRYASITNGMQFSCALTLAGEAQCWGWGIAPCPSCAWRVRAAC